MTDSLDRGQQPPSGGERADAAGTGAASAPLCFVVDEEPSIRSFLSLILHGCGIDTQEFANGASFQRTLSFSMSAWTSLSRSNPSLHSASAATSDSSS